MKIFSHAASLLLVLVLSACSSNPADNAAMDAKLSDIMEISGLNSQLENIPLQIGAGLQQPSILPADFNRALATALGNSFDAGVLKSSIKDYLHQHLSVHDTDAVLDWLYSPLGQKIATLEAVPPTPETQMAIQQQFPQLLADPRRFALIRSLDKATNASSSTMLLILSVQEAVMRGMMAGAPASQRLSDAEIKSQFEAMAPQARSQYELVVIASLAYTYRSLSNEDIAAYIDFSNSPAGAHFNQTMIEAITVAMKNAGETAGKEIGKIAPVTIKKTGV